MSSNQLPIYIESETDQLLETTLQMDFNTLQSYAYNYGNYLLDDPHYKIFELAYTNSRILSSTLLKFTSPVAEQNTQAIRWLHILQRSNLQQTTNAYQGLISPCLQMRMYQQHLQDDKIPPFLGSLHHPSLMPPIFLLLPFPNQWIIAEELPDNTVVSSVSRLLMKNVTALDTVALTVDILNQDTFPSIVLKNLFLTLLNTIPITITILMGISMGSVKNKLSHD